MLQRQIVTPQQHDFLQVGGVVRGEKQWQQWAQDLEDFSIKQTDVANKRLPYASTLQLGNLETADRKGPVRGEKQWQQWAQDLEDFGDKQTTVANTRLPYASTLQLSEESGRNVRGEKQWQAWAQDLEDFSIKQTDVANKRLPYASTLQLDEQGAPVLGTDKTGAASTKVRGEKHWQPNADTMEAYGDHSVLKANTRLPYASTLAQISEEPKKEEAKTTRTGPVRGEKQWQGWAGDQEDYAADATKAANTRLPYASTLQLNQYVQTRDDGEKDDDSDDDDVEVSAAGEKYSNEKVPLDFHFVHISNDDGELVKIENNEGIPLNFRF